jgi:electron transport complex protein RnfG
MKNIQLLVIGLKLCAICAVAALCLGLLNEVTEPQILARKVQEEKDTLAWLVPGANPGEKVIVDPEATVRAYYPLAAGEIAILDLRGVGYGGDMKIMAAYRSDGSILSVRLLDNQETPGLGKRAESPSYMEKFLDTGEPANPVPTSKEMLQSGPPAAEGQMAAEFRWFPKGGSGAGTDTVSGATITFLGVSRALEAGSEFVRKNWGGR